MRRPTLPLPPRRHQPLDCSCTDIESEQIPRSHFDDQLDRDLRSCPMHYLELHYPELTFRRLLGPKSPTPKGAYKVRRQGGWIVADWRTGP